jgi:putative NIF3 family GTP cyclohydrolase 1 type 2
VKAREVRDHFLALAPWVDPADTVDRIVAGDPEKEVRSCLVAWIASLAACREALRRGADLLITHEPTFYVHWDRPEGRDEEFAGPKRKFIEDAGLAVLRIHDVWDTMPEVGVPWAWARFLGFAPPPAATVQYEPAPQPAAGRPPRPHYLHRYDIAPTAAGELARRLAARTALLGEPVLQFVGDETKLVSRIGVGTGCACSPREFMAAGCDCSVVCDDGTAYWRGLQLAEDRGHPVIRVNHGTSEEPAMATLAEHVNRRLPGVRAEHLPHRPIYRPVGAAAKAEA